MFNRLCLHSRRALVCWEFFIMVSISMLVIGLFIFSVSSWFCLGRLYLSKNCVNFFQVVHFIGIQLLVLVSYNPLYSCRVSCNFSFFKILLFEALSLFSWWIWLKVYKFYFFKELAVISLIFSVVYFISISFYFCSNPWFLPSTNFRFYLLFL